jgi:hypothetical protein
MGQSVFPAPSTSTSIPGATNKPPKFTYSTSYDLSSLTNMNNINSGSTAMTYRRTDGCIYFTSSGVQDLWKFNTSTNTGSHVGQVLNTSNAKDIVAAYDGTLYYAQADPTVGSVTTPLYSTDGGATWTALPTSTSGTNRGFLHLIDSGVIPGAGGNVLQHIAGAEAAGDPGSWWDSTTLAPTNTTFQTSGFYNSTYYGGRGVFPLRDGDDVKAETSAIWLGALDTNSFSPSRGSTSYAVRPATIGLRGLNTTTKQLVTAINPVITGYAASGAFPEPTFKISKPTTIDSRWIVSCYNGTANALEVIDYTTLRKANSAPLPYTSATTANSAGNAAANPVYVSATKKLYVLQAASASGTSNVSKMHVYDVTTY